MGMPRLLFVCAGNADRSQMAEGFARFHGGYQVEALSAGADPVGHLSKRAIEAMAELGIDIGSQFPRPLDHITGEFDAVVTMGCGDACPWMPAKQFIDWQIPDPKHMEPAEFNKVRDYIKGLVSDLLTSLDSK